MKFKAGEPDEAPDAKIMKITNVFFNPISAFAQTNLINRTEIDCLSFQQEIRDGPFNFQGGGYGFFLNKYSDSQCYWKKNLFQSFCHNLMLNFGEKKLRFVRQKINIIALMLSGKFFLNEAKNHNPPPTCKLNGWSLNVLISEKFSQYDDTFSSSLCHSHYNKFINNSQFSALFVGKIVAVMTSYGF